MFKNLKSGLKKCCARSLGSSVELTQKEKTAITNATLTIAGIGGFILGVALTKRFHIVSDNYHQQIQNYIPSIAENRGDIDEAIFTDLAPEIENMVLAEGVDEGLLERTYTVAFPKFGDESKGIYEVLKKVVVTVTDIGDAE